MPQHHRTMPDRPYRADGGELGSYEPGVGEGAGELELESEPHRARASWIELERARATIGQASPSGRYGRSGRVQWCCGICFWRGGGGGGCVKKRENVANNCET